MCDLFTKYFMIFSYVNLPNFPEHLIDGCLQNIDKIDEDIVLYEKINKYRGKANSGTWVTKEADQWLKTNIIEPYFSPVPSEMELNLLNVTTYVKNLKDPKLSGSHGPHKDVGRIYALNYYLTLGGSSVRTIWYDDDEKELQTICIEPYRWCILKVDQTHGVKGIRIGQLRTFLSLNINQDESYIWNKLGDLIYKDSVIKI